MAFKIGALESDVDLEGAQRRDRDWAAAFSSNAAGVGGSGSTTDANTP